MNPASAEMDKAAWRARCLRERGALTLEWVVEHSALIARRLMALAAFRNARHAGLYCAIRGEVHTDTLLAERLERGLSVWVPAYDPASARYRFARWDGRAARIGFLGIPEPYLDFDAAPAAPPLDAIVVPGVAFDRNGVRLGRGAGWYDRLLAEQPAAALKVGLAYDWQVVPALPVEPHDVRMDVVVTENETIVPGPPAAAQERLTIKWMEAKPCFI